MSDHDGSLRGIAELIYTRATRLDPEGMRVSDSLIVALGVALRTAERTRRDQIPDGAERGQ